MNIDAQPILAKLQPFLDGRPLWLAFSGGLDSTVLVHLLASQIPKLPLKLIHINHQLHGDADNWALHCQQFATVLDLPFTTIKVDVNVHGLGLEAAARQARYDAIAKHIGKKALLLTGQHQQDQAETLMLQLLRGAGNRGLSAMAFASDWQTMTILRPLLDIDRATLAEYARYHQLEYLDDPSNDDISIQRNYLRQQIWPLLQKRWPALNQTLSRSAGHLNEAQSLLDELAVADLQTAEADKTTASLNCQALLTLSPARQRNALRSFLHQLLMPLPTTAVLQRMLDEVCAAKIDAQPLVEWSELEARRFAGRLYIQQKLPPIVADWQQTLHAPESLLLPDGQYLNWQPVASGGMSLAIIKQGLVVRFRQGGEKIQLAGHLQHHDLKNCLQNWQVSPWQRKRIPLLFANAELVAVSGFAVSETAIAASGETGWWPTVGMAHVTDF